MSKKVFSTEYAPVEEIEGVKTALTEAGIVFYEVPNSKLWLGGGSICIRNDAQYEEARRVIETFQAQWRQHARTNPVDQGINWTLAVPLLILFVLFVVVTLNSIIG